MGNICSNQIFEESQKRKTFQFNYILDTIPEEEEYETDSCYDRAPKKSNFSGKSCQTSFINKDAIQRIQGIAQAHAYF